MNNLEVFKTYLTTLLDSSISKHQLDNIAKDLKVDISGDRDKTFQTQRRLVQAEVLRHITRESDEAHYVEMLKEVEGWLNQKVQKGFNCTFTGCLYKTNQHRYYLNHLNQIHFLSERFLCNFSQSSRSRNFCKQVFSSYSSLEDHVNAVHCKKTNGGEKQSRKTDISLLCKCNLMSCGERSFGNLNDLLRHYNSKEHCEERRVCIFENCDQKFVPGYKSRQHFDLKHKKTSKMKLKPEFLITDTPISLANPQYARSNNPSLEIFPEIDDIINDEEDVDEEEAYYETEDPEKSFFKVFADFLNRLSYVKMVPQSTIDFILEEFILLFSKAKELQKSSVKLKLNQENISESTIDQVMAVMDQDKIFEAICQFNSNFKRDKFIEENFSYIAPQEILLNDPKNGDPKESFHYVSIIEGVRNLFQDQTFLKALEASTAPKELGDEDKISEICDGSLLREIPYFKKYPGAFAGQLYSDAVEITSPLGSGKGRHKIIQLFWTIANLKKKYKTKIDTINVAIIVQDRIVKKYGYQIVYKKLIEDMKALEEGITVDLPFKRVIRVGFCLHLGDNLEQHSLGMLSVCFSSKDICRKIISINI